MWQSVCEVADNQQIGTIVDGENCVHGMTRCDDDDDDQKQW